MRHRIALAFVLLVGLVTGLASAHHHLTDRPADARIEEDSPLWDCATMGNRICGKDRR